MSKIKVSCVSCWEEINEKDCIFDNIYGHICYKCINKKFIILEYCKKEECKNNKLEPILDEKGYVMSYFCDKCSIYWFLEDLKVFLSEKYGRKQKSML